MTLDELLAAAREQLATTDPTDGYLAANCLARAILDLLGEAAPCGWPAPETAGGVVHWEPLGCDVAASEARAIAAMLLRAADEAEAR